MPFSALTVWYLPGLDHVVHLEGMGAYKKFFKEHTDDYIKESIEWFKQYGEFDNKIFIVISDHGMTDMPKPDQMTVDEKDEYGNVSKTWKGNASCKFKIENIGSKKVYYPELANNNLHIWELGEMFKTAHLYNWVDYSILTPTEIASLNRVLDENKQSVEPNYGATTSNDKANVIAALNGPMAHIYLKGDDNNWTTIPNQSKLTDLALIFKRIFQEAGANINKDVKNQYPNLLSSIDKILIRDNGGDYKVFKEYTETPEALTDNLGDAAADYIKAKLRIEGLNDFNRSGDIVLIMKDRTVGNEAARYTTGVACKSWHGSLNPSDSYVPLVVAYPGGTKSTLETLLKKEKVCGDYSNPLLNKCKGNWNMTDIVNGIIAEQYK